VLRWCGERSLPSVVAASALAASVFLIGPQLLDERPTHVFLVWNLFLAWVPYGFAVAIEALHKRGARSLALLPLFLLWLGFLPNAPYLVTDFIHLRYRNGAPLWFDAVMLASFAWAGVGLGAASLRACARVVRERHSLLAAGGFVSLAALATGFGIYLGRFVRLNTWDVATKPGTVLSQVFSPLMHPFVHPRAWTVTLTFALFFVVAYIASGALNDLPEAQSPREAGRPGNA
jgi:uncharacterized membrane protein